VTSDMPVTGSIETTEEKNMQIQLGWKARDPVSGYQGTAVARCEWLYDEPRIALQGPLDKDGNLPEEKWFPETRLQVTETVEAIHGLEKD